MRIRLKAKPLLLLGIILTLGFTINIWGTIFGIRIIEEPNFTVILEEDNFQVREYDSYVIAEVNIAKSTYRDAGDKAFRKLFKYITGENGIEEQIEMTAPVIAKESLRNEQIEMTAPVIAEKFGEGWNYAFVLPSKYNIENAPKPSDSNIKLREIESKTVAVISYSGSWRKKGYDMNLEKLKSWILKKEFKIVSVPRSAGYDPPWAIPFLRRNEVMIDIK